MLDQPAPGISLRFRFSPFPLLPPPRGRRGKIEGVRKEGEQRATWGKGGIRVGTYFDGLNSYGYGYGYSWMDLQPGQVRAAFFFLTRLFSRCIIIPVTRQAGSPGTRRQAVRERERAPPSFFFSFGVILFSLYLPPVTSFFPAFSIISRPPSVCPLTLTLTLNPRGPG